MKAANWATASSHAFGAAFDNPDLIVSVVVGDGEAETGPLATSWHSNKFLNPIRDGAVLPILHLNGYKIANPTMLARITPEELENSSRAMAGRRTLLRATIPQLMHQQMAAAVEKCVQQIRRIQQEARSTGKPERPRWPMIILRIAEGLDRTEGSGRAQSGRISGEPTRCRCSTCKTNPEHLRIVEEWMRSYRPEELFDEHGSLIPELRELPPEGERRMSANPHANGGKLRKALNLPDFRDYAVAIDSPGNEGSLAHRDAGQVFARRHAQQHDELSSVQPRRECLQSSAGCLRSELENLAGGASSRKTPTAPTSLPTAA